MAGLKVKTKLMKSPKQVSPKVAKPDKVGVRGGLGKTSVSANLRKAQKEAKPKSARPIRKFNM